MSDSDSIVSPGTILAKRYELTEEIGRGGFGMVYRARQLNMDRAVAVKILPPKFMSIPDVAERFRREARLASRLRHPNTITVHDYGKQENLLFIVMELLEGEDLADVLMRKPKLPMDRILHIGRQVLKSLREAHEHKIIHRDLKPENIFLTRVGGEEDFVKVLDFGIAKLTMPEVATDSEQPQRKLTMSGSTVGTPTYMSPEQAAGEEVDGRTDLYALGVILYEMACGRPPFRDDNPVKVMRSHLFEEIPRFPKGPLRDSRFEAVIMRALEKDAEDRMPSAREFLKALEPTPTVMLERLEYDVEPPTIELPDLAELESDTRDADHRKADHRKADHRKADHRKADHRKADHRKADKRRDDDIAFENTAAYDVEGSDALSPRAPHDTESMLGAQKSTPGGGEEVIPFTSVPERDRVPEGAASSSGLTDSSGLTSRSDLTSPKAPPAGFISEASSSSIITVLEPGPDEDVILLTKKKDGDAEPSSPAADDEQTAEPRAAQPEAVDGVDEASSPSSGPTEMAPAQDTDKQEWSWSGQDGPAAVDEDDFDLGTSGSNILWVVVAIIALAAAAAGYLHFSGHIALF
jgi:eukaryotic-like serine/threonine-protein kinase